MSDLENTSNLPERQPSLSAASSLIALSANDTARMTSQEIADLVGARHDNVRRTIDRLAEKGVIQLPPLEEIATGARAALVYVLTGEQGKRDSYIVVAQLCPEFTAKIVDRWQELEQRPAATQLSRMDLIQLALAAESEAQAERQQRLMLEAKVEADAPAVAAMALISASAESMTFTQVAKVLGRKRADVTKRLNAEGWIYRQNGSWLAYRQHIQNGRLEYKEANYTDQKTGMACCKPYCHVTPKGFAKLATMFGVEMKQAA